MKHWNDNLPPNINSPVLDPGWDEDPGEDFSREALIKAEEDAEIRPLEELEEIMPGANLIQKGLDDLAGDESEMTCGAMDRF